MTSDDDPTASSEDESAATSEAEWLRRDADAIAETMKIRFFPFALESQEGSVLTGVDGDGCIDFSAAWAVANTGYRHPTVLEEVREQLESASTNSPLSIPHPPLVELAERLVERVPGEFEKKAWFGHSGSEAGDLIWKLLADADRGDTVLTFGGSYHGQTMGAATLSGHAATGDDASDDVAICDFPGTKPGIDAETALEGVDRAFDENDVAGVITEPIQSDGGIYDPPQGFLAALEERCRRQDAYFVVDETKAGLGRTGTFFAFERDGVTPDAVMIGKPLGSGLPISAVVGRETLLDALPAGHLMTTAGNPLSAAAGLGTLDALESDGLVDRAATMGDRLRALLDERVGDHECVADVRGRGLMQGVELRDPRGDDPAGVTAKTVYRARERGLIVFYVGLESNVLEITPPLTIEESELERGVDRLAAAIDDVRDGAVDDETIAPYAGW
ncbi:aspartate aminotransferase family protein [Natrarchaeobius sp. A-rgal3]|uniref:aspartate aminotransferase family protein n=1 Tax=Natrarchaeobius versutus TaxID=1679078 RepID=UPI00350F31D0